MFRGLHGDKVDIVPILKRHKAPDLYYEVTDYTDPWRSAPYLLLQHGFGRSSKFWYRCVPYLARYYRIIRPDLRGFGRSSASVDPPDEFTIETCIRDLEAILDAVGAESVHYCGESLGGILGMPFAAERPRRVRTLTLIGSGRMKSRTAVSGTATIRPRRVMVPTSIPSSSATYR